MLVQHVFTFLSNLKAQVLEPYDVIFSANVSEHFKDREANEALRAEDILFLNKMFADRWQEVADDANDYTLNPLGVNREWIVLAKELSAATKKDYVHILMPVFHNTFDYNNLSSLSETSNLDNFYFGQGHHGAKILFRKRGLSDLLNDRHYKLATCRTSHTRKQFPISIIELWRLKSCKISRKFTIENKNNSEHFTSFWDFIEKKVYPRLRSSKGTQQPEILQQLQQLVNDYFSLKLNGSPFAAFKQKYNDFLAGLYEHHLDDINYFYGTMVPTELKEYYLVDLLIEVQGARNYLIDEVMSRLRTWLNTVVDAKKSQPIESSSSSSSSPISGGDARRFEKDLVPCYQLILSLFSTELMRLPLTGTNIVLWDKNNQVFSEAVDWVNRLVPHIESGNKADLYVTYQMIFAEIKAKADQNASFLSTNYWNNIQEWYETVSNGRLAIRGVHWFEPSLLLHVFYSHPFTSQSLNEAITQFLDKLIHTYAQTTSECMKKIRVNILFAEMLKQLSPNEKNTVIMSLDSFNPQLGKDHFSTNVALYISQRLKGMNSDVKMDELVEAKKAEFARAEPKKILDLFRTLLHSATGKSSGSDINKLSTYLAKLSQAILTQQEKAAADKSVQGTGNYMGYY